jgi:hypothetical protein
MIAQQFLNQFQKSFFYPVVSGPPAESSPYQKNTIKKSKYGYHIYLIYYYLISLLFYLIGQLYRINTL